MLTPEEILEALAEVEPEGFDWLDLTKDERIKFDAIAQAAYSAALRDAVKAMARAGLYGPFGICTQVSKWDAFAAAMRQGKLPEGEKHD